MTADGPPCALTAAGLVPEPIVRKQGHVPVLMDMVDWRPYQEQGIMTIYTMLREHGGAILGDDMGLGKTPQGAAVAAMLGKQTLVVCPAGVRHQWQAWLTKLGLSTAVLGPVSDKRYADDWHAWKVRSVKAACVSYNLMDKALAQRLPETLIFDEPHNYLQGRANTYVKTLWKYIAAIPYKLALTGTPYLSKPAGLWQLLNILLGLRFGRAKEFDIRYCNGHQGQWGWDNRGATHIDELRQRLSFYMLRRMKAEVARDLPKVTRTVRWVDADPKATAAMAMAEHTVVGMRGAVNATLRGKDAELKELMKQATDADTPTVVFTWKREDADRIGHMLITAGHHCMVVHGEQDAAARAKVVDVAYAKRMHVVTTYGSSGQGLDGLQRWCSNVIYHAIDPVPAIVLQASGRLDRIGQTLPVTETYLAMRESVDELTVDKVVNKLDVWQSILGKDKSSTDIRNALVRGGLNPDDDAVLAAIFKELTNG